MTEDIRATPPLELHTPWKPSPNGRPKALTPPSDHSRDSADVQPRPASRRSLSPAPKHRTHDDTASEPAPTTTSERNALPAADAPPADVPIERRMTPGQRRPPSVISAMSCSMCSATGVNSLWRRDRAGKPICGKCCEQLRRRMNPRYAVTSRGEMSASRPPAQTKPIRRRSPSPNSRPAPYPARSPLPGYSQPSPYSNGPGTSAQPSPTHNGQMNGDRLNGDHGYPEQRYENGRHHEQGNHLTLPPLSSIERVADQYRREQPYRMKEPVSLPAAPSSFPRPRQMLQPLADHRRPTNGAHDPQQGRRNGGGVVTEAEIQQKRALLVEGRKWIFSMLDGTTAMLRQLDEASLHMTVPE
ncbi:hypothetical protein QFC20_007587 [Naganishia adeliensis]|uniref:Uncharacterized protein n=1 Tax=Naganishia adeliensis TaxID=92952 RepID=A0ACC2UYX6_9TREE|nr:hypothetical protein QFC20_007587 [Naganishia adeliensis]